MPVAGNQAFNYNIWLKTARFPPSNIIKMILTFDQNMIVAYCGQGLHVLSTQQKQMKHIKLKLQKGTELTTLYVITKARRCYIIPLIDQERHSLINWQRNLHIEVFQEKADWPISKYPTNMILKTRKLPITSTFSEILRLSSLLNIWPGKSRSSENSDLQSGYKTTWASKQIDLHSFTDHMSMCIWTLQDINKPCAMNA